LWEFSIAIVVVIIAVLGIWCFIGLGAKHAAESNLNNIQLQVAHEAEEQYAIAKRNGSPMDIYVRAGLVAEAYLQAKDEVNYKKWKQIETEAAIAAGIKK